MTPWKRLIVLCWVVLMVVSCKVGSYIPKGEDVINISVSATTIKPGDKITVTIYGSMSNGLPMPDDVIVQLKADKGSFTDKDKKTIEAVALVNGKAEVYYQSDSTFLGPEVNITATCGSAKINPEKLVITIEDISVTQIFIEANPLILPVTGGTTTITATALDKDMKGVADKMIWFETTAGKFQTSPNPATTNSEGKATIKLDTTTAATVTATYKELKKDVNIDVRQPPTPSFTYSPINPISGEDVYFNPEATIDTDGTYDVCDWDFGDGEQALDQKLEIVSHNYHVSEQKVFTVTLTARGSKGFRGVVNKEVTVDPMLAIFTWFPVPPKVNEPMTFNASNSQGKIRWYRWSFGDGGTKETAYPSYTYTYRSAGFFDVTLTILGEAGEVASSTMTIKVVE